MKTDVVVIGGGAAGMLCAAIAAERGLQVVLLEPNRMLGRKLRITGKGRCNVTNACEVKTVLDNIPGGGKFLRSALHRFPPAEVMALFEDLGVPLKVERGNRVFPVSDKAADIVEALERYMDRGGVRIIRQRARELCISDGAVSGVTVGNERIDCRNAVVCTGGLSYPATGSTGDGYDFARSAGHTVCPCRPSLVPLESPDAYCAEMQGFSLRNVILTLFEDDKRIYRELGEMMFTHFGVTGPLVLSASAHMQDMEEHNYRLEIDLKPGLDEEKLNTRILRDFEQEKNKEFKNALGGLAGRRMIPVLVRLSGIDPEIKVHSITREQRLRLVSLFKHFPVSVTGKRPFSEAIITAGGVALDEVDPRTMESKLTQGLYFAGEVLNLDAYTGGFNLQIAWSTAYVAGNAVS